jgi:hypothetical protein
MGISLDDLPEVEDRCLRLEVTYKSPYGGGRRTEMLYMFEKRIARGSVVMFRIIGITS